jgi:hypothetical protein
MKLPGRFLTVVLAVAAGSLLLAACGDGEQEATATATPTPTATATPETPTGGTDPEDFAEFAELTARAAAEEDTAFFTGRVKGRTHTCSEIDVEGGGLGGVAQGLCQEVGQQLEVVELSYWYSEGVLSQPESLERAIDSYFASALPEESDEYGTGAAQLYAIAESQSSDPERPFKVAILTAMTPRQGAGSEPVRTARGILFNYVEGRWVIRGMLTADVLAEELLSPETAPFSEWERY